MSAASDAERTLEWWDEQLAAKREALAAEPLSAELSADLEAAEGYREHAYTKASQLWEQEQDRDYAAQWASWAYGPDVNPVARGCRG